METPRPVFEAIKRLTRVDFDLDPCTAPDNHLGLPFYFTKEQDGLRRPWAPHRVFVNPPFSEKELWLRKAILEAYRGAEVVVIQEAQTDSELFHEVIVKGFVYLLRGRIRFLNSQHRVMGTGTRGHLLVYYGRNPADPSQLCEGITVADLRRPSYGWS